MMELRQKLFRWALVAVLLTELVIAFVYKKSISVPVYNFPTVNSPYFSLGDAVAALALVFAVYQLSDGTWGLVMDIKGKFKRNLVWFLVGLGLVFSLISSLLSRQYDKGSVVANPLFWQIIAFTFFAAAPFTLRHIGSNKTNMFTRRKAERFYRRLLESFSTGDPTSIKNAVDIVEYNLDSLTEAIRAYKSDVERRVIKAHENVDKKDEPEKDYRLYAIAVIETAFSDDKIAAYIATQRIDFIWNFVNCIKKHKLTRQELGDSFSSITAQLFNNKDSYLYRQKQYKGTGRYAPVNDLIFSDKYLAKHFSPLRTWSTFGVDDSISHSPEYCEVLLRALESTLDKCDVFIDADLSRDVSSVLYDINDYALNLVISDTAPGTYSINYRAISKINKFYSTTFLKAYTEALKNNKVSDYELKADKGERFEQSLTASYTETFIEFLAQLSLYEKEDMLHHLVIFDFRSLFDKKSEYENMRKTLFENAWDAIRNNVEHGFYPAFVRIYIRIMYFQKTGIKNWIAPEREKLLTYLENTLKPKIRSNEKMSDFTPMVTALLPSSMTYNPGDDKYYWSDSSGNKTMFD